MQFLEKCLANFCYRFHGSRMRTAAEHKYLDSEITIDELTDRTINIFRTWKLEKMEHFQRNRDAVANIERIENEDPAELAEANASQDPITISDMDDSDTEVSADQREDRLGCFICANEAVGENQWGALDPCGHIFCDACCTKFKIANKCAGCKQPVTKVLPVYATFTFISRAIRAQAEGNYQRPQTMDERCQENVLAIRRMGALPSSAQPIPNTDTTNEVSANTEAADRKLQFSDTFILAKPRVIRTDTCTPLFSYIVCLLLTN